ncbi:murein hydrolase activator EnvC family protein [Rubrivirga sp. IMCC43871]|uniref:murein hydrolase activator EnvC family protein n=1 Tax=Rubrivirga sp. IMCC43871 TaxID=3391575 RepID=UPI00398FE008
MRRIVLLAALVALPALSQDRAATERRLNGLQSQIAATEQQVRRTRGQETSALQALESMDAEVQLREQLVLGYRTQIGTIETETGTLRRSIERLETEIEEAKRSYRRRARHAYVHGRRNGLALILASGSVNQMLVRARYLQQFAQRRRGQVEQVARKSAEMQDREREVRVSLEETQRLLQQSEAERGRIAARRAERAELVTDLQSQRGRLERELDQRRTDAQQLAGVVQDLVAQERRRAEAERQRQAAADAEAARVAAARAEADRQARIQREADQAAERARIARERRTAPEPRQTPQPPPTPEATPTPPAATPSPPIAEARPTPEPETRPAPTPPAPRPTPTPRATPTPSPATDRSVNLTGSFRSNRGRLPQPVDGTVTGPFGTRRDGVTGTTTSSPGIDYSTAPGAPVRSVFEGVVQRVGTIPTYGTYIMVTHGEFVTLYGNLSNVAVSQGATVRAGQVLGRSGTPAQRRGAKLFFALYDGGQAVNPSGWLR